MICTVRPMHTESYERYRFSDEEASFGTLSTGQGHLPLRKLALEGSTMGLAYRMRLTQTFINVYSDSLEATYIFPLPARAAVTRFVMRTPDREVVGELQEREQARATYDQAIASGFQAAIAEEDRPEVFTMRVGNIPGCSQVEIELELSGPLAVADGMATFRFPLVVAPRYMPGRSLGDANIGDGVASDTDATPDASRISPPVLLPGYPNPVQLTVDLELDLTALGLQEIECSLHELVLDQLPSGHSRLRLRRQGAPTPSVHLRPPNRSRGSGERPVHRSQHLGRARLFRRDSRQEQALVSGARGHGGRGASFLQSWPGGRA